jgi:uncharacterized membrane protein
MLRRRGEAGEGQGGCIFGLLVLLLVVFVSFKVIPIKVRAAELKKTTEDSSRSAGTLSDARIRAAILGKAKMLELPVNEGNVKINRHNDMIRVEVDYIVPVEFPGYTHQWSFRYKVENPIF